MKLGEPLLATTTNSSVYMGPRGFWGPLFFRQLITNLSVQPSRWVIDNASRKCACVVQRKKLQSSAAFSSRWRWRSASISLTDMVTYGVLSTGHGGSATITSKRPWGSTIGCAFFHSLDAVLIFFFSAGPLLSPAKTDR